MNKSQAPKSKYVKQIEEQQQMIEYLKQKYKESTGYDAPIPIDIVSQVQSKNKTLDQSIQIKENKSILIPYTQSVMMSKIKYSSIEEEKVTDDIQFTFYDALNQLNLPQKLSKSNTKSQSLIYKKPQLTNFSIKNKFHMVQSIDLSGYKGNKFTRQAFRDFLEQIEEMRALHTLNISKNGIDDVFQSELCLIITNTFINNLDLSHNELSPKGIQDFIKTLKDHSRFKSINLSHNQFSHDLNCITNLSQSLIAQKDLLHVTLDAYRAPQIQDKQQIIYKGADVLCKMIQQHKNIESAYLIGSSFTADGINLLKQILTQPKHHLIQLSLKFCFLTRDQIQQLSHSLSGNYSLVHVDLSYNCIDNIAGLSITQMLQLNTTIHSLDLEHNNLSCNFISPLCQSLTKNNVISILKLGNNYIGKQGGKQILQILGAGNDTIEDLGKIEKNQISLNICEQINKKLTQNKIMRAGKQLNIEQEILDENLQNYKILKPIDIVSQLKRNQGDFKTWMI